MKQGSLKSNVCDCECHQNGTMDCECCEGHCPGCSQPCILFKEHIVQCDKYAALIETTKRRHRYKIRGYDAYVKH